MQDEIDFKLILLRREKFRLLALVKFFLGKATDLILNFLEGLKTSFQKMYIFTPPPPPQTYSF